MEKVKKGMKIGADLSIPVKYTAFVITAIKTVITRRSLAFVGA